MKLHIKNGRLIDPANNIDALQDLFIDDGKVAAVGTAPAGFVAERTHRRRRPGGRARPGRPVGAPARAGLRIQGHAGIGNAGGDAGRRDQPGLPARHRSGAGRTGPGRDAQAPRARPEPGPRASARRADHGPEGQGADRDGGTDRSRLHRLLAGRGSGRGHQRAAARAAVREDLRATPSGCARRMRTSAAAASPTPARWPRASAWPACR